MMAGLAVLLALMTLLPFLRLAHDAVREMAAREAASDREAVGSDWQDEKSG